MSKPVFRLGIIVNPFAGIVGALALKGSDGAQIREKSDTALKPYIATKTTITPTADTTATNAMFVGYQLSWAGMPRANRTAVADTVIIAAEITVKMMTFAQL